MLIIEARDVDVEVFALYVLETGLIVGIADFQEP